MDNSIRVIVIVLTVLCNIFLAWLIYTRSASSRKVGILISTLCLFIPLWTISNYYYDQNIPYALSLLANRLVFTFTAPLIAVLVHLAIIFPADRQLSKKLYYLIYSLIFIFVPLSLTDFIVKDTQIIDGNIRPLFNFGAALFGISTIIVCMVAVVKFRSNYINAEGYQKQQMQYFILGITITALIALFTNLILPMFFKVFSFTDIGPASSLIFISFTSVAIIRFRLFDIKFIFGKIIYFLLISLLPNLTLYIFYFVISKQNLSTSPVFYFIGFPFSLLFLFLYNKLNNFAISFTDSRFIYPDYNPLKVIEQYKREVSNMFEVEEICNKTLSTIARTIRPEKIGLIELIEENRVVHRLYGKEVANFDESLAKKIIVFFNKFQRTPLIFEELNFKLKRIENLDDCYEELHQVMEKTHIRIYYPLYQKDKCMGFLYLGTKEADYPYSIQEINFLSILVDSLTLNLHRSNVLEEARKFNVILKSKIQEATKALEARNIELNENKTELQRAYRQLKLLDDAKSDFISIASHQLRTPLSIIKGYLSMLGENDYGKVNTEQKRIIDMSIDSLSDLNSIVNEILTSSRIEKGSFAIVKVEADIIDMVKYVYNLYKNKYEIKGLDFKLVLPKNIKKLPAMLDKDKFEQVVINLIENAFNYTPKGGVTVTLENDKSSFTYSVQDTGIGIPKDSQDKLFERFTRLENAQKIRPDGTGIGLYTAKVIVEKHGGKIWFKSTEGKGTTFFVKVPLK